MYKYLKKIIAIILCISIVFSIDNVEGLFGYPTEVSGEEIELNTGSSVTDVENVSGENQESGAKTTTVEESTVMPENEVSTDEIDETTINESESSETASTQKATEMSSTEKQTTEKQTTEKQTTEKQTTENKTTEKNAARTTSSTKTTKKTDIEGETTSSPEAETTVAEEESTKNILENKNTKEEFYSNRLVTRYAQPATSRNSRSVTASQAWDNQTYDEVGTLTITSRADWKALVAITHNSALEGAEVLIQRNTNWKNEGVSSNEYSLSATDLTWSGYDSNGQYVSYTGIGCAEYPFRGTLSAYLTVQVTMPRTLFTYMSSEAKIDATIHNAYDIYINYTRNVNVKAALAEYLIIESEDDFIGDKSRYININFGTSTADTVIGYTNIDVAGGLFAHVNKADSVSAAKFIINDNMLSLGKISGVYGRIAGGIVGEVGTGVTVEMSGCGILPDYVYSYLTCAGGVVGKLDAGSTLKTADTITDINSPVVLQSEVNGYTVAGTGAVGGLIGIAENATVDVKCIKRYGSISGSQYAGGLIGVARYTDNASEGYIKVSEFILAALYVAQTNSSTSTSYCSGGVIGKYEGNLSDDGSTVATRVEISNVITAATKETTVTNQNFPKIMTYTNNSSNYSSYLFNGGVIGGIYGNNVKIHDINLKDGAYKIGQILNFYTTSYYYSNHYNTSGTIAGSIVGKGIEIDNITIAQKGVSNNAYYTNGISGSVIGGIAGRVGWFNNSNYAGNKIKVSNIHIESFFTWAQYDSSNTYAKSATTGGLFGYVHSGSIISLDGDIDLSGLTKYYMNNSYSYRDIMGSNPGVSKGFVAGYAIESLIYFERNANVKRPVTARNGIVYFNFGDSSNESASACSDLSAYRTYCVDDIGNYGSVYRNLANESGTGDVIDFSKAYGSEVTGTVGEDGDSYIIDSLQDALRLSIAGHTFVTSTKIPIFGANCFDNATIDTILNHNLVIACNLNLSDAGIHGFVRNDSSWYGYSKRISGKDGTKYTITMDFISKQMYGGLFPVLTSGATVQNLNFNGCVCYERGYNASNGDNNYKSGAAGAIASNSVGSITLNNVDVSTIIKGYTYDSSYWSASYMYSYGGYVGYVNLGTGDINVNNCTISPTISNIQDMQFAGGLFGRVAVSSSNTNINVENSNICTTFSATNTFGLSGSSYVMHSRAAGLIGFVGRVYCTISETYSANSIPAYSNSFSYRYTDVKIKDCNIKDATIDLTNANASYVYASGGLLGYAWCNVNTTITGLTIENSVINSRGYVGGLVSYINGYFNVESVKIDSLAMKCISTNATTYSSFLFGNAEQAYVRVVEDGYQIDKDNVTYSGYTYFDEIVGKNLSTQYINTPNSTINNQYIGGGVLNIINSKFSSFNEASYASYKNRVVKETNRYTRYYYNLFEGTKDAWTVSVDSNSKATIDTPKKLMTLQVALYANSNVSSCFSDYISISSINGMNITGNLDMSGYSYYPIYSTQITTVNGNNHTITLYGKTISDLEKGFYDESDSNKSKVNRNNEYISDTGNTQHYMMHASLFNYNWSGVTISNITLSGSVAYNSDWTGALISGALYGKSTISNITVKDLYLSDSAYVDGKPRVSSALLISRIGVSRANAYNTNISNAAADMTVSGIKTEYTTTPSKAVASSLIYTVGTSSATDVKIHFKQLVIGDRSDENVFQNASLIYDYNYINVNNDNRNFLLYTFDYSETVNDAETVRDDSGVTYGKEIQHGLNYNNYFLSEIAASKPNPIEQVKTEISNSEDFYLPYVAKNHSIFVNPRNGDITEGCGTYEDPYVIKDAKQLLSLYCYISGKTIYDNVLANSNDVSVPGTGAWKVNKIGGNGVGYSCSEKDTEINTTHVYVKFKKDTSGNLQDDFPSKDDLRTAYYIITKDIDLSEASDLNDYILLQEYSGLCTQANPFAGVIVGKSFVKDGVDTLPTITLPKNSVSLDSYGLIQYMQGAVVKDLTIVTEGIDAGNDDDFIKVTSAAGGVAARIVGGDNIIDNVTTRVKLGASGSTVMIGGYVGEIQKGSLIIRNAAGNHVVKDCEFANITGSSPVWYKRKDSDTGDIYSNSKVGLLVGHVKDGFIIYENSAGTTTDAVVRYTSKKVLTNDELQVSSNTSLEVANGFNIINGYAIDEKVTGDYKIGVSASATGNLEVKIRNGEGLEVIALALNSDALSIAYDTKNNASRVSDHYYCGYDYTSKCRKAKYSDVGADGSISSDDRNLAVSIDDGKKSDSSNIYLYPYLCYRYMDFDGSNYSEQYSNYIANTFKQNEAKTNYVSKFNKVGYVLNNYTTLHTCEYTTTYFLDTDNNCDNLFDVSGYGESFRGLGALYYTGNSNFRANFDGNQMNVKIQMRRNFDSQYFSAGMFNDLVYDRRDESATADKVEEALTIKNINIVDSIFDNTTYSTYSTYAGALTGNAKGVWNFENIVVKMTADGAAITDYKDKPKVAAKYYVGGLIGSIACTQYGSRNITYHNASNKINITACKVEGYDTSHPFIVNGYDSSVIAVGGLVGGIGAVRIYSSNDNYFGKVVFEDCQVLKSEISTGTFGNVGGFVGYAGSTYSTYYSTSGNITVKNSSEKTYDNFKNIENVTLKNSVNLYYTSEASIGGMFGKAATSFGQTGLEVGRIVVSGFNVNNLQVLPSTSQANLSTSTQEVGIGGVIGYNKTLYSDLDNIHIENSYIGAQSEATNTRDNCHTGGIIGYSSTAEYYSLRYKYTSQYLQTVVSLKNTIVKNTLIASNKGSVGGYIGKASSENNSMSNNEIEGCTIVTNSTDSTTVGAGGVIGFVYHANTSYIFNVSVVNQEVLSNTIKTVDTGTYMYAAGGIIGCFPGASGTRTVSLNNIYVGKENHIMGNVCGGGLAGYVGTNVTWNTDTYIGIGAKYDTGTGAWVEDTDASDNVIYNNISGKKSGGLIGANDSAAHSLNSAQICVAHNRIYSYDKAGNYSDRCSSGGLVGYQYLYNTSNYIDYSSKVYVKNNIIATSGRGLYAISNSAFYNYNYIPVAGGVYGTINSNSNNSNSIRFPYLTLEDNSIGLYYVYDDSSADKYNTYKNLQLNSSEIKLLKYVASNSYEMVNWSDESIDESNIAKYSYAFGKFIGYYTGNKQINILNPVVKYTYDSNTQTANVGSIPAIDVGNLSYGTYSYEYGTSYPYFYRNTCHIVYLGSEDKAEDFFGDSSLLINADDEYFFKGFEDIIKKYNTLNQGVTGTTTRTYNFIMSDRLNSYVTDTVKNLNYNLFADSDIKNVSSELSENIEELTRDDDSSVFKDGVDRSKVNDAIKEFVTKYNSVVEKMSVSGISAVKTSYENLIAVTDAQATSLSAVGITIDTDKKLVVDDSALNAATVSDLKALFGPSGTYAASVKSAISSIVNERNYYDLTYSVKMFFDNPINEGKTEYTDYNGVPVIVLDGQDVQRLVDSVALVLTNGGGAVRQNGTNYMSAMRSTGMITIDYKNAYIAPDGKIYENSTTRGIGTGTKPSKSSIDVSNYYQLTIGSGTNKRPYDEMVTKDDGVYYTITLLRYKYTVDSHTEVLYIPVYVKEKVTMYENVRVLSGENYYYPDAKSMPSVEALQVSHGSTYTIFTEFVYDSIRNKNNFKNTNVNKTLVFQNSTESLQDGTKLTLIDVGTGIAYYYTVNLAKDANGNVIKTAANRVNKVKLTEFKDSSGNAYKEKVIGNDTSIDSTDGVTNGLRMTASSSETLAKDNYTTAQEMGVERFFLYFEPPEGDYNTTFNFSVEVDPVQSGTAMSGFFDITLENKILFDAIWGPQISFKGIGFDSETGTYTEEEGLTYIYGDTYLDPAEIRLNKEINIESYLDISVPSEPDRDYWMHTGGTTIDSVNDGKSIDVALSLTDLEGEEVSWPEGTNIFINGKQTVPSGNVMYLYLDTNSKLAFDTLQSDIDGSRRWYYCDVPKLNSSGTPIRDANGKLQYESRWITKYGDSEDETDDDLEGTYYYVVYEKITDASNITKNVSKKYTIEQSDIAEIELNKGTSKVENERTWYYYNVFVGKDEDDNDIYEDKWITLYGQSSDETDTDLEGTYYYVESENGQETKHTIYPKDICERVVEDSLSNYMNVKINFASADIDDYADKKFMVKLKIYRSSNYEFPAEEEVESNIEEHYTEYAKGVEGRADKDIGVAITADNPLDLGINLYHYTTEKSTIRFTNKFDFTNSINKKKIDDDDKLTDVKTCAANTYMVTYRLQKKVLIDDTGGNGQNNTYVYQTISWEDSPFSLEQIEILDTGEDKTVEWDNEHKMYGLTNYNMETLNADQTTTIENVYIEYKKFTYDEVLGTLQTNGEYDYVIPWNLKLTADMAGLDNNDSLANYRITATYVPYDETAAAAFKDANGAPLYPNDDSNANLEDYIIFTVAKLKTDMD